MIFCTPLDLPTDFLKGNGGDMELGTLRGGEDLEMWKLVQCLKGTKIRGAGRGNLVNLYVHQHVSHLVNLHVHHPTHFCEVYGLSVWSGRLEGFESITMNVTVNE